MANIPAVYLEIVRKAILSLIFVLLAVGVNVIAGRVLHTSDQARTQRHTLRMLVRNSAITLAAVAIAAVWLGVGSNLTVAMGIFGAGIAFASQEVLGSFAGYINIVTGGLFHIGDRVRIGDVVGDVLDISMMRTTLMEIGEWVKADQYTGRIVTVANREIFASPLFNYTQSWPYLWDELTLPFTYESDWRLAAEIMVEHGQTYTNAFQAEAQAALADLMRRYPIHVTSVEPTLYIKMTDNWIEITLRYIVDPRSRRKVMGELHGELLQHFEQQPTITVASATFEIVGFPSLRLDRVDKKAESGGGPVA